MASGNQRLSGQFLGTGAIQSINTVQWRPRGIKLYNRASNASLEWSESFPDDSGKKTVAAGTVTFITTGGITPLSNGFILGADTNVNTAAGIIYWEAWQ